MHSKKILITLANQIVILYIKEKCKVFKIKVHKVTILMNVSSLFNRNYANNKESCP